MTGGGGGGGPEHGRAGPVPQHHEGMGFRAWQEAWFGAGRESVCEIGLATLPFVNLVRARAVAMCLC